MKLLPTFAVCGFVLLDAARALATPTGFWRFEPVPGFTGDSSGNGRSLTNDGDVAAVPSAGPGDGQAAVFSGSNRLTAPDSDLWHSTAFTVEAYFRAETTGGATQVIVSHHNNTNAQRGWNLSESGGKLRFAKSQNGSGTENVSSFPVAAGKDYFAAAVFDGAAGTLTMVLKDMDSGVVQHELRYIAAGTFDADSPLAIGATGTQPAGTSFFKGAIDNVRFTAEALETTALQEPFESVPIVPSNPVVRTKADGYKGIWFTLGQQSA